MTIQKRFEEWLAKDSNRDDLETSIEMFVEIFSDADWEDHDPDQMKYAAQVKAIQYFLEGKTAWFDVNFETIAIQLIDEYARYQK